VVSKCFPLTAGFKIKPACACTHADREGDLELKRQIPDEPDTGIKQISADFKKRCFEIASKYFNIDG